MSTIGSISSSASAYSSTIQRQRPDPAAIADSVFSKLDTKSQGYLEVSDLEAAFSKISGSNSSTSSTSSTNSTTASSTSSSSTSSTDSSTVSNLFKTLDSNSDGKVTKDEFSSGLKKLSDALETQFNARRTNGSGSSSNQMPPPPPDGVSGGGNADDGGLTQSQLSDLATNVSSSNSSAGSSLSTVAKNFDAADTNQDGKVSLKETLAYLEKVASATGSSSTQSTSNTSSTGSTSSTTATSGATTVASTSSNSASANSSTSSSSSSSSDSSSSSSTTEAAMFKKVMQLLHAYSDPFQNTLNSTTNISVSA